MKNRNFWLKFLKKIVRKDWRLKKKFFELMRKWWATFWRKVFRFFSREATKNTKKGQIRVKRKRNFWRKATQNTKKDQIWVKRRRSFWPFLWKIWQKRSEICMSTSKWTNWTFNLELKPSGNFSQTCTKNQKTKFPLSITVWPGGWHWQSINIEGTIMIGFNLAFKFLMQKKRNAQNVPKCA